MMWLVAATGPARATTTVFVIIALLVTGLAAILLLRLWALVRQERRRCRQESLTSLAALLRAPEKSTRLHALTLLASFPLMELSAVEGPLWDMMKDPEPEVRQAANRLMLMLHPPDQLLHQLSGRQMPEKLGAIEGLAAIGGQKALAALLEAAARASEEPIRRAAKAALARGESPGVSPFLITALDSTDPILRATAKDVFRDCGLRALPPLLATLRDPRKPFRATAAELIGDLGLQEGAEALVSLLSDPVDEVRAQAARALGNLGQSGPGIMAALAEALSDSSTLVQEEAANALSSIDDSKALVPLLEFLRQRASRAANWHTPPVLPAQFISRHLPANSASLSACKHLFESADDAFLSTLARIMEESPENVKKDWIERLPSLADDMRETLHSLLVSLGKHGLREPFRKQIHDHSPANAAARAAVARLLGEIEADDLGEEIFALLSDPDYEVRRAAAWAGGRIPHFATIDGLCQALSDPDTEVRTGAARSLTHLIEQARIQEGLPEEVVGRLVDQAGAGLLQAINDPVNGVRQEVARALGFARIAAAVPSLVAWALGDENPGVREAAAEALIHMPPSDAISLLAEALSYEDENVRGRAAEILGAIGDPVAVSHLIRSLQDESPQVREAAGRSLWEIGFAGHGNTLGIHLQSPDPKIRASIAGLLGKVQAQDALDGLVHVLRDPNEFVRAAVVNAFANLGPLARRHLSALIERLEDPDAFVRARTVRAIFAVGESEPQVTEALAHAVEDEDPMVVAEALQAMLELAARGVLEPLAGVVSEPNLRKTACDLLAKSEASTLRLILTAAKETSGEIQVNLLGLLTETMKSFGSVEEYKKDLASAEASVRLAALEALSLFGIEEATEAVIEVLKNDPVAQVRQRAAMLLGQLPKENVQRVLIHAAEQDLDPDVRETARSQIRISS